MALITDPFMKVKNTANVFAIGDCCTVQNEKLADFFSGLLGELGVTQTGKLSHQQFTGFCLLIICIHKICNKWQKFDKDSSELKTETTSSKYSKRIIYNG